MYLYNTWEETGDESVECRALRKFLRQIELHKMGQIFFCNKSVTALNSWLKVFYCKMVNLNYFLALPFVF